MSPNDSNLNPSAVKPRQLGRWLALGFAFLALLVAARFLPVLQWIEIFRVWTQQFGTLGFFLYGGMFALVTIFMLPCLPFTILAGFTFGLLGGLVAIMFGIMVSAAFGFLFARYAAREAVAHQLGRNARFRAIDGAIAKEGWKIVGLLRMCPVPFGISNYLYGLTGISFWRYWAATFVGMLPGNILFVYLGAFGKRTTEGPRNPLEYALGGLAICALVGVTFILRRIARRAMTTVEVIEG
ncbi:MAG: TVP38/TMEM64 family protein [Chthoniobacterales bacterium]